MRNVFLALALFLIAAPAMAWGYDNTWCTGYYYSPNITCGPAYSNWGTFTGSPYVPLTSTTFPSLSPGFPIQTTYSNGMTATTYPSLTPHGPIRTIYNW